MQGSSTLLACNPTSRDEFIRQIHMPIPPASYLGGARLEPWLRRATEMYNRSSFKYFLVHIKVTLP